MTPLTRKITLSSLESTEYSHPAPRWGEYDSTESERDNRMSDGLTRFRNNFDCCHQVPIEGRTTERFEGHMIPKPNNVDCSSVTDNKSYRTSSKEREATFEVFPQHQATRLDNAGNFILEQPTREAIDQLRQKLYGNSRYNIIYPENANPDNLGNSRSMCEAGKPKRVRFADDIGYNLEIKPTPRQDYEAIINLENWPRFEPEPKSGPEAFCTYFGHTDNSKAKVSNYEHPFTAPIPPKHIEDERQMRTSDLDKNQNHHFLTSAIYNYRLPSALHQEGFTVEDKSTLTSNSEVTPKRTLPSDLVKRHNRPAIPEKLILDMQNVKEEMKLMEADTPGISRTIPVLQRSDLPCTINQWVDSADSEKLRLRGKSELQKRFHQDHPDPVPDLREHTRYSKKVFFDGFNSCAYRG